MTTPNYEIAFVEGPGSQQCNGSLKRRIALRIDGKDVDVVTLRLDSEQSRSRQAKTWAERFSLDLPALEDKLRRASVIAAADAQRPKTPQNAWGAKSPPVPPMTLAESRVVFGKWLKDTDQDALDVVFGTVMAHRLDGDPVWLFIIAGPGDGKTEAIRSLSSHEDIFAVSSLTPGALISGYINDNDGPDPSLLPKLDGKVLTVKDFTAVLTMNKDARTEILGTLRDAYDGEACKAFGTGEVKTYKSRFGMLAAVTPVIESHWSVSAQLGERFLRFRLRSGRRVEKTRRALFNANDEKKMRHETTAAALGVLAQQPVTPTIPNDMEERLIHLADFVSRARSEVARNKHGIIEYVTGIEVGTRVGKSLKKLAMGIAMARGVAVVDEDVYRIILRVGMDCIPSMRATLVRSLWNNRGFSRRTAEIGEESEVGTDTVKVWLDDLRQLGMVDRGVIASNAHSWKLKPEFVTTIEGAGLFQGEVGNDSEPDGDGPGGVSMGVPPNSAPHALLGSEVHGGPNHPPPPYTYDDGSETRESEAIMAVEGEAEALGRGLEL